MSLPYTITGEAWAQILQILDRSALLFGDEANARYEKLVFTAISDIAANPNRPGSRARLELGCGARSWHLRLSRERARTDTGIVNEPRHLIFYRVEAGVVIIEHVLHERQDVRRYFAK